ncbi:MAG: HAD family hydrolase [Thermoprotei archaeon]
MLRNGLVISIDFACTLFWEPGCDPRYTPRCIADLLEKLLEKARKMGYSPHRIHMGDLYEFYKKIRTRVEKRGSSREVWYKYILLKLLYGLNVRIKPHELDDLYEWFIDKRVECFMPMRDSRSLLEYLKGMGYTVVLTTATASHDFIIRVLEKYGYIEYFDLVYSTQLVGIPKENPDFYRELVDLLGVEPYRIVHIGDSLEHDIISARRAGLKTIYYGWRTMCRAADPQPCVTSLSEIPLVLPTISTH